MKTIVATFTLPDGRRIQATGLFEFSNDEGRVLWSGQRTPGDHLFTKRRTTDAEPPDRVVGDTFETLMQIYAEMSGALLVLNESGHWTLRP